VCSREPARCQEPTPTGVIEVAFLKAARATQDVMRAPNTAAFAGSVGAPDQG